ncbi:ABC transporter permease [Microbacterium sp. NPDC058269]|uniref:ABC transporter permease n=1 Tax=Microbacterium sp. NPDC058269 TaxID=3346414 RepID=UPI0036D86377
MGTGDVVRLGSVGLRSRPMRAVLSALGIALGIAAMVAVVGISTSGQAQFQQALDRLGTNLLTVSTGQSLTGDSVPLPKDAPGMIERIRPVTGVTALGATKAKVYRSDLIPAEESGGIATYAADLDLLQTLGVTIADGAWLNAATAQYPAVVLGSTAAAQLGIDHAGPVVQVRVGGALYTVVGILDPAVLAPKLDLAALIGWTAAKAIAGFDGNPTEIFARTDPDQVTAVRDVLAATANPAAPNEVDVSRPSDALEAAAAADQAFTGLLLGVGAVALLVGGVGVANTMVISVLERRGEVGLRRSLGATRGNIRLQFFSESLLLAFFGGLAGVVLGVIATTLYAASQGWPTVVPAWASLGGMIATVLVGGMAGLYPAIRAARLAPTEALSAP